ncbi:VOC family protein [Amantichitinum ursilacus]|uniref:Glyoxalase-like domain protein n=1 Tax=Amantichitinum ursilacus TaxID=857265 RepID=A0A0N1JRL2_9NEIS|nr:VOC family protein [Amantichitinum ursilacus]KPC49622.1 Glyoxalase-like domain protein [Amantichitinum ursilacus]
MKFASVRLVTRDVARLVGFYNSLSGVEAVHLADGFAEVRLEGITLAISAQRLIELFNASAATAAANQSAILEFEVTDVETVFDRMAAYGAPIVMAPTTMPWGNRSLLLRDPDGNLVNVFARPAR